MSNPATPQFLAPGGFGGPQRRTSNFFPVTGGSKIDFDLNFSPESTDLPFPDTSRRHHSSPLIGGFNKKTNGSSRFFGNNHPNGNQNESVQYYSLGDSNTTTPTPSLGISLTPSYDSNRAGLTQSTFNDTSAINISQELQALSILSSPNQSLNYIKRGPGPGPGLMPLESPVVSSGSLLNTSATTSESATPLLAPSSIWNDNSIYSTTAKLGTLDEYYKEVPKSPILYSPLLTKDFSVEYEFDPTRKFDDDDEIPPKPVNIFSQKVNNPSFVPNQKPVITKPLKLETRSKSVSLDEDPEDTKIHVCLPNRQPKRELSYRKSHFSKDMVTFNFNRYSEDYSSTFYKRNAHGYMFVKEPTNSLKVNNTGGKSWVQLKIKLPAKELDNSHDMQLSLRKLRVDIKRLPVWKPINLNGNGPNYKGVAIKKNKKRDKRKGNVSRRFGKKDKYEV